MNQQAAKNLSCGLYRLFWKEGGWSYAAVGMLHNGRRWFAPCNWTSVATMGIASTSWHLVKHAGLIEAK